MEFKSLLGKGGGINGRTSCMTKSELRYNTIKGHTTASGQIVFSSVFYIGNDIMKKARVMIGDYVDILISDCGNHGLIKRVTDGGRKIGKNGSNKRNCGRVAIKKTDDMPLVKTNTVIDNVVINDDGILFDWPKAGK